MAAAAGLLNHGAISGYPMAASTTTTNGANGTNGPSAGITANDFLTLLVTEMKNQDPTANTDPNEYINQLVNVNSLQQLISINQTLTGAFGSSNLSAYAQPAAQAATTNSVDSTTTQASATAARQVIPPAAEISSASAHDSTIRAITGRLASGNLSVPVVQPAADRLAHALDGHLSLSLTK